MKKKTRWGTKRARVSSARRDKCITNGGLSHMLERRKKEVAERRARNEKPKPFCSCQDVRIEKDYRKRKDGTNGIRRVKFHQKEYIVEQKDDKCVLCDHYVVWRYPSQLEEFPYTPEYCHESGYSIQEVDLKFNYYAEPSRLTHNGETYK